MLNKFRIEVDKASTRTTIPGDALKNAYKRRGLLDKLETCVQKMNKLAMASFFPSGNDGSADVRTFSQFSKILLDQLNRGKSKIGHKMVWNMTASQAESVTFWMMLDLALLGL